MRIFSSHGKLLLTGEYLVLDGGLALAIPTSYGQELEISVQKESYLHWQSFDANNTLWFTTKLSISKDGAFNTLETGGEKVVTNRLIKLLNAASTINPDFAHTCMGKLASTRLDFLNNWGLGTSSTLINNIAQWAKINPYKLLHTGFGGSGYDIACAQSKGPIWYKNTDPNQPEVNPVKLNWTFKESLFFVHLNKKMDSKAGISSYRAQPKPAELVFNQLETISNALPKVGSLDEFEALIRQHERLIGKVINKTPIQEELFGDYAHGAIKSLGAWGGDFVLATGNSSTPNYFKAKGYNTVIPFNNMALKNPKST